MKITWTLEVHFPVEDLVGAAPPPVKGMTWEQFVRGEADTLNPLELDCAMLGPEVTFEEGDPEPGDVVPVGEEER
jgi:hypothetical protein